MSKYIPIGDVCYVYDGPHATPTKTEEGPIYLGIDAITPDCRLNPAEYAHLSPEDYILWTKRVTPKKDDVVFSYEATLGRYAMIPEGFHGCLGRRLAIVRTKDDRINPKWLYYYFLSPEWSAFIANHTVRGSTVDRISVDDFPQYPIPDIDRKTQDLIVSNIQTVDQKIELNNSICAELESMAKTLYDYWFVQFDFPDANGKPYRTSGGEMVWNEQLKREIPKGWDVGMVDNLGSIVSGGTPTTTNEDYYTDNGIAWITPNDLSGNEQRMFVGHGERDISVEGLRNSSATLMPENSVLFSSRAPIGYIAISTNEICTNQGFKSIVPDKGYGAYYIYYTIKRNTPAIAKQGVGTTFKEVSGDTLKKFRICLPTKDIAELFEKQVQAICERRRLLEQENTELSELRDWLLPMLMNGQATIARAEPAPKLQVLQPEKPARDPRFDRWLQTQGVAARGTVDEQTLHDIFDAMDDDDKQ